MLRLRYLVVFDDPLPIEPDELLPIEPDEEPLELLGVLELELGALDEPELLLLGVDDVLPEAPELEPCFAK